MWDKILEKASKKMIVAIVAMFLVVPDTYLVAAIAVIAIACQWSLDWKFGRTGNLSA